MWTNRQRLKRSLSLLSIIFTVIVVVARPSVDGLPTGVRVTEHKKGSECEKGGNMTKKRRARRLDGRVPLQARSVSFFSRFFGAFCIFPEGTWQTDIRIHSHYTHTAHFAKIKTQTRKRKTRRKRSLFPFFYAL